MVWREEGRKSGVKRGFSSYAYGNAGKAETKGPSLPSLRPIKWGNVTPPLFPPPLLNPRQAAWIPWLSFLIPSLPLFLSFFYLSQHVPCQTNRPSHARGP